MGSITYDFLADSLLFHQKSIDTSFQNETDSRIEQELENYRQHCIDNYSTIIDEVKQKESSLKVFSSAETSLDLLKQTALYVDQFVVSDPLFQLTAKQGEQSKITSSFLGYSPSENVDRNKITQATNYLKEITPMVAGDYIKLLPLSYYFEGPEQIPINFPENNNNDILPKDVLDFFWKNVKVHSLEKMKSGGWSFTNKLIPSRGIVVNFHGDFSMHSAIYHLFEVKVLGTDDKTRRVTFAQTLPDTPPDPEYFKTWVNQSVNTAARGFYDKVYLENFIAANLNSTYLCDSSFTGNLITNSFETKESIETYTTNQIINFELPFLDQIDIQKLMEIRELDADVFTNFRLELEKQFRELRTLSDPQLIQLKKENIFHELNEVQVNKIKQKINHHKKQMRINSLLAIGGLAGSVQTAGVSLLGTALALGKGYKDYKDYQERVRENPSYLLWKIKK